MSKQNYNTENSNNLGIHYSTAYNAIKLNLTSANYIDWNILNKEEKEQLINTIIELGYTLSENSPLFLKKNRKIALASIKKNINTISYVDSSIKTEPDIVEYLILNNYPYTIEELKQIPLNCLTNQKALKICLKKLGYLNTDNQLFIERLTKLFLDFITTSPLLKNFDYIFQNTAEKSWDEHKSENIWKYRNLHNKICSELKNATDFNEAIDEMPFLSDMEDTLGDKYKILHNAMLKYFNASKNQKDNSENELIFNKNIIAELSALHIAKSKENYKKKIIEQSKNFIQPYFSYKIDNPYINKRIIKRFQEDRLIYLYQNNDEELNIFINNIIKKYNAEANTEIIKKMIEKFILFNYSKIEMIISPPQDYENYLRYEKAIKLIRRLNSKYIKYDGPEVAYYKDIISYDEAKKEYIYTGKTFTNENINNYQEYKKLTKIFSNIKKEIITKTQSLEYSYDKDEYEEYLEDEASYLPLCDKFFTFNQSEVLKNITLSDLISSILDINETFNINSFTDDNSFANIHNILINTGLIWILIFMKKNTHNRISTQIKEYNINKKDIICIINNIEDIAKIAKDINLNINILSELILAYSLYKYIDRETIAILGKELIEELCKNTEYTSKNKELIIKIAKELACQMTKKNLSTVPYINGNTENYNYSLYDDKTAIKSGIITNSCLKPDGTDNDFFHYCLLNKNGFIIKITDNEGNIIAKAAGFRNGNCIFINQLRTIYDETKTYRNESYTNEMNEIIETLRKACQDIINISQNNPKETNKIDFVFITQSYIMTQEETTVSNEIVSAIGEEPMDKDSDDWKHLIDSTDNLEEASYTDAFETDYDSDYPIICLASSKKTITPEDIKKGDVEALYERKRNKITIINSQDLTAKQKINEILAIKSFFDKTTFNPIEIPKDSITFIGDNWYIIYYNGVIINYCILEFDNNAKKEFNATKITIEQYKNQQQINIQELTEQFQENTTFSK